MDAKLPEGFLLLSIFEGHHIPTVFDILARQEDSNLISEFHGIHSFGSGLTGRSGCIFRFEAMDQVVVPWLFDDCSCVGPYFFRLNLSMRQCLKEKVGPVFRSHSG